MPNGIAGALIEQCGNCRHAALVKEDLTIRSCRGAPPQLVVLPTPKGLNVQPMWPAVKATEQICGAYKPKITLDINSHNE